MKYFQKSPKKGIDFYTCITYNEDTNKRYLKRVFYGGRKMDSMTKKEFEELKRLLVKYRNQTVKDFPDDKEGISDIERIIGFVNIELKRQ